MSEPSIVPRPVGGVLMIGLVALPIIFVWLLLRPGYSASLRKVVFVYALIPPVLWAIAWIGSGIAWGRHNRQGWQTHLSSAEM